MAYLISNTSRKPILFQAGKRNIVLMPSTDVEITDVESKAVAKNTVLTAFLALHTGGVKAIDKNVKRK